jgi:hypothetical protein
VLRWLRDRISKRRWPELAFPSLVDQEPFAQRLAETKHWCGRPGPLDPRTDLRSRELMPWILESNPATIIYFVAQARAYKLRDRGGGGEPFREPAPTGEGRLLVHYPGLNLVDGAAEVASEGFFDMWNLPPWDTWVAFGTQPTTERDRSEADFLICWVPPQLVELANLGIEVNPEQCIAWLDKAQLAELRAAARMP